MGFMSADMHPSAVIERFQGLRRSGVGYTGRCPAHADRNASLSVRISDDGKKVLVNCFAGCRAEAIVEAVGLSLRDLFDGPARSHATGTAPSSPLVEARRAVLREARRHAERLEPWRPALDAADDIRIAQRLAAEIRRAAAVDVEPDETTWERLAEAARVERDALAAEADAHTAAFGRYLW
jgi:hypothetical protein